MVKVFTVYFNGKQIGKVFGHAWTDAMCDMLRIFGSPDNIVHNSYLNMLAD